MPQQRTVPNFVDEILLGIAMWLSLGIVDPPQGSAMVMADQDNRASRREETAAARIGVCEREGEKLVGQKPIRIGPSMRAPKKLRDVRPKYPEEFPPNTVVSVGSPWLGEVLITESGKVTHVWPIREVAFQPPFPAFNNAITDAIYQWVFEPFIVMGKPMPVCMTVTVFINIR